MKKYANWLLILTLALVLTVGLCACGPSAEEEAAGEATGEAAETTDPAVPEAYAAIIGQYQTALSEGWEADAMVSQGLNILTRDCHHGAPLDEIGYAVNDVDGNGTPELAIGSMVVDEFFGCMLFDLYTLDENGTAMALFISGERNRLYYAGDDLFAQVGSSSAADSIDTTLQLTDGSLTDLEQVCEQYQQMVLDPLSQWEAPAAE